MTVYNFSAGPAVLPRPVLEQVQAELCDWHQSGMSVMEMSHRGPQFAEILQQAEADLRQLLAIPSNYRVLFMQGGALSQFAMLPMNLLPEGGCADYVNTGSWSTAALREGRRVGTLHEVASSQADRFTSIPPQAHWQCHADAAYLHYVSNETIGGVEFHRVPATLPNVPLVADMSSNLLSRPVDVSAFGVIYAGAQKNIGPAGVTLVIVRDDLLGRARPNTPSTWNYQVQAEHQSMINTPPTFAIYVAGLVFKWLLREGGLSAMEARNIEKADLLYRTIEQSQGFYCNPVQADCRSRMNVPFTLPSEALTKLFLQQAEAQGLLQLKGHKSVGGCRASIYNAMPLAGVQALTDLMREFAQTHA